MELSVYIGCVITRFLNWLTAPLYSLYFKNKSEKLPPITDPLLKISAKELARKIRTREIRSLDVIKSYIKRIKEVDHILEAVIEDRFSLAIAEAEKIDTYLSQEGLDRNVIEKEKPLLGIPITVKESCSVKGLSLTAASLTRIGIKATQDGEAVRRVKEAGAIVIAVSNTPEMCLGYEANNFIRGRTRNPFDTTRTSAGSSGGEGALLGSAGSLIGVGSDLGGSIRIPAMFNGVFGHKPTARVIPIDGHYPIIEVDDRIRDYLTIGPMARYSEDLLILMKVLSGNSSKSMELHEKVDLGKLNIYFMEDIGDTVATIPVQDELKKAVRQAVGYLRDTHGCNIKDTKFNEMPDTGSMTFALYADVNGIPNLLENPSNPKEKDNVYLELLKTLLGKSKYTYNALLFYVLNHLKIVIPKFRYRAYVKMANQLKNKFINELNRDGVLIMPTFPTSAYHHTQSAFVTPGFCYCLVFNALGMPSTNVPVGLDAKGLPIGIQIIGAPYQDRLCLAVAQELEKCFGGWIPPK